MESTNSLLIIAPEAKLRIEEALAERGVPYFRVYIQGGGCSGYSYQFDVASEKNADDFEMTLDHGAVLVDAASATPSRFSISARASCPSANSFG